MSFVVFHFANAFRSIRTTFEVLVVEMTTFPLLLALGSLLLIAEMSEILATGSLAVFESTIELRNRITHYYLKLH